MSKGLSKRQTMILFLLRGDRHANPDGDGLSTRQICDRLLKQDAWGPWKTREAELALPSRQQMMFTTWRALDSLFKRGLVIGIYDKEYGDDQITGHPAKQVFWRLKPEKK